MQKKGPWGVKSIESVYENNWIKIEHHEVITPGGNDGIYGKICFKNLAIGIIPVDSDGYTWLVKQFRYPLEENTWEIPEGGGSRSISPLDSAKRELLEEVGIKASKWKLLQEIQLSNSASDEIGYVYLAEELTFFEPEPEDTEELEIKRLHLQDFFNMIHSGEITDSLSILGGLKLENMLLKNEIEIPNYK